MYEGIEIEKLLDLYSQEILSPSQYVKATSTSPPAYNFQQLEFQVGDVMIVESRIDEKKLIATMCGLTGEIESAYVEFMKQETQQLKNQVLQRSTAATKIRARAQTRGFETGFDLQGYAQTIHIFLFFF